MSKMPTFIDEKDNEHGDWTVLHQVGNNDSGAALWLCRCVCGKEAPVTGGDLRSGASTNCGCKRSEAIKAAWVGRFRGKDEKGNKHGSWEVLYRDPNGKGRGLWWCRCVCGKEAPVTGGELRSGNSQSCGCVHHEELRKRNRLPEGEASFNEVYRTYVASERLRKRTFELTKEEARALFLARCHYCGAKPAQVQRPGGRMMPGNGKPGKLYKQQMNGDFVYNGIDRVDNSVSYVISNCVTACRRCNIMKGTMSADEFIKSCRNVADHQSSNIMAVAERLASV